MCEHPCCGAAQRGPAHLAGKPAHRPLESVQCQLAEGYVCLPCGEGWRQVYLNARNTGQLRVEALSDDAGASFILLNKLTLKERPSGCQGAGSNVFITQIDAHLYVNQEIHL